MCKPFPEINALAGSASECLLVGLGAIPGAWLRLKVVNHFQPMVPKKHWGTFIVNVVACFALGLVLALNETCTASTGIALLMGVGFFGSLSTFSTFAVELAAGGGVEGSSCPPGRWCRPASTAAPASRGLRALVHQF